MLISYLVAMSIVTALLSYGMSGRVFHAPFIDTHPGFKLAGSWERSKKQIRDHYLSSKSYDSLDSILNDESIQLVVVNTPTNTHYEFARKALNAGKHVIVEKAFTTTASEAMALDALAEAKGKMLSVYQNRRWDSDFLTAKSVIDKGLLGDLVEITLSFERYKGELSPKLHKELPGPGAGLLNDLGPHLIDQALVLFGMPDSLFTKLAIRRKGSQVDDYFEILMMYPSFIVRLRSTYFAKEPGPAFVLHGTRGTFQKLRGDVQEADLQKGLTPTGADWGLEPVERAGVLHLDGQEKTTVKALRGDYMAYYEGIYQAIKNGVSPPVTAADGVNVMKILEAARRSDHEQRVVAIV